MMSHIKYCCFLLTLFVGVFSEKKSVNQDSFALLFDNVTADNSAKEVSLYINGANNPDLIVKWKIEIENGDITANWRMHKYEKIFMDGNRNIRIANIDKMYEGKYYIQSSQRREVELAISGINYDTTTAQSQKDGVEEKMMPLLSSSNAMIIVILVFIAVIAVGAVVFIYHQYTCCQCKKNACCQCKKKNVNEEQTIPLLKNSQLWTKHFGNSKWEDIKPLLNDDQQQGLQTYCETVNAELTTLLIWTKRFGNLKWEEIKPLLNDDQQQGLQTYCDIQAQRSTGHKDGKMRKNLKRMANLKEIMKRNVYALYYRGRPFDPNIIE